MSGAVSLREIFTYPARLHRIFYPEGQIGQSDERVQAEGENSIQFAMHKMQCGHACSVTVYNTRITCSLTFVNLNNNFALFVRFFFFFFVDEQISSRDPFIFLNNPALYFPCLYTSLHNNFFRENFLYDYIN